MYEVQKDIQNIKRRTNNTTELIGMATRQNEFKVI